MMNEAEDEALENGSRTGKLLAQLGEGLHRCGRFRGWLSIDRGGRGEWSVLWTSHKTYHLSIAPALGADYSQRGDPVYVYQSAVSLWMVDDESKKKRVLAKIDSLMERAIKMKRSGGGGCWI